MYHWLIVVLIAVEACLAQDQEKYQSCTTNCSLNFINGYSHVTKRRTPNPGAIPGLLTILDAAASEGDVNKSVNIFEELCGLCDSYHSCLSKCVEPLRGLIEEGLAPVRYLCKSKRQEYKESLPCLVKNDSLIRNQCETQIKNLAPITATVQNIRELPLTVRPGLLELYCQLTTQYMDCAVPAVNSHCGAKASGLIKEVQDLTLIRIQTFLQNPLSAPVPKECNVLLDRARNISTELRGYATTSEPPTITSIALRIINEPPPTTAVTVASTTFNSTANETAAAQRSSSSTICSSASLAALCSLLSAIVFLLARF